MILHTVILRERLAFDARKRVRCSVSVALVTKGRASFPSVVTTKNVPTFPTVL